MRRKGTCRLCGEEKEIRAKGCCSNCYAWERYHTDPDYREKQIAAAARYRERHSEASHAAAARYYRRHREKECERAEEWKRKHPDRRSEHERRYYMKHHEECLEKSRAYYRRHREEKLRKQAIRQWAGALDTEIGIHPWRRANEISYQEWKARHQDQQRPRPQPVLSRKEWGWSIKEITE